ncbi:3-oxoacyl-ACP synthase III family protein [Nocardia sp. NPDC051570]|uniref:3-oxoacyl-ACP synthase III family protein n=1 Tax=Nocardia sp. NPDC051570 TaxID=3364324 RepID=UPI0037A740C0
MRRTRFESIGRYTPETKVSTRELISRLKLRGLALERLTGVRNRHVYDPHPDRYESSFVLAQRAMRDCLRHSAYSAADLDIIISASTTRTVGPGTHCAAPAFALMLATAIGADRARHFDIDNGCAGMLTGVAILDRMIKAGVVRNGMVVAGEQLTAATESAVRDINSRNDSHLEALTVGDAGIAVIVDDRGDDDDEIHYIELMTTPAETHSDEPIQQQAIDRLAAVLREGGRNPREESFDFCIYHQSSAPAITRLHRLARKTFRGLPTRMLNVLADYGNTASTSHFLVLHEYLRQQQIPKGSRILMIPQTSGIMSGCCAATVSRLEV